MRAAAGDVSQHSWLMQSYIVFLHGVAFLALDIEPMFMSGIAGAGASIVAASDAGQAQWCGLTEAEACVAPTTKITAAKIAARVDCAVLLGGIGETVLAAVTPIKYGQLPLKFP